MSPPGALFPRRLPAVDASSLEDGVELVVVVVVLLLLLRARRARRRVSMPTRARIRAGRWADGHDTTRHPRVRMRHPDETTRVASRLANTHWRTTTSDEYLVVYDHERNHTHTHAPNDDRPPRGLDRPTDRRGTGDGRAVGPSVRRSVGRRARGRASRSSRSSVASARRRSIRIRIRIRRRHRDGTATATGTRGTEFRRSVRDGRRDDEDVVEEIDARFVRGR